MQKTEISREIIEKIPLEISHDDVPDEIVAIYLYGSILKGRLRLESDIDIAILPHYKVNEMKALELISKIESIFTKVFKKFGILNEVSIVNMRGKFVSIELLFNIILHGICVFEKSMDESLEFKNFVMREYLDFRPFLKKFRKEKYELIHQEN
jgi:predicted nucleotidyltransferase